MCDAPVHKSKHKEGFGPCFHKRVWGSRGSGEGASSVLIQAHPSRLPPSTSLLPPLSTDPSSSIAHKPHRPQPLPISRPHSSFRSSFPHPPSLSTLNHFNHESPRLLGPRHHRRPRHAHHNPHEHARARAPVPEDTQVHAEA